MLTKYVASFLPKKKQIEGAPSQEYELRLGANKFEPWKREMIRNFWMHKGSWRTYRLVQSSIIEFLQGVEFDYGKIVGIGHKASDAPAIVTLSFCILRSRGYWEGLGWAEIVVHVFRMWWLALTLADHEWALKDSMHICLELKFAPKGNSNGCMRCCAYL